MSTSKRRRNDENTPFIVVDPSTPVPKRPRLKSQSVSLAEIHNLQQKRAEKDAALALERQHADAKSRVAAVLGSMTAAGYNSLYDFVDELLTIRDQQISSRVSKMLGQHGEAILNNFRARQPDLVQQWALNVSGEILAVEGQQLADYLKPGETQTTSDLLQQFSLERIMSEAEKIAPTLCQLLREVSNITQTKPKDTVRKDRSLVLVTVICMLAQTRNERSSEFQTTMCIYLLACGASRSQFDVLNHAGFTLSYKSAVDKIKDLGQERLLEIVGLTSRRAFMVLWDNLNIAFRVGEQRKASKDHFDNGTTATLIPLYDVEFGGLPLDLKPPRDNRRLVLDLTAEDLLPSRQQVEELDAELLWHVEDILLDAFPDLRTRFKDQIKPITDIFPIPLHKTQQYPLPAMHIDESSLEGTLQVLESIISKTLQLSSDGLEKHGIILCAGDQLTMSLLDKASASRRDDSDIVDNVGRYTEGQLGLFHVKMAGDRMIANEFWGVANSTSPWSLWKINSLLGRKAISAGWKAKSLPPFRPTYELILQLTLPANILDGFRIFCPSDRLERWVAEVKNYDDILYIAKKVHSELCTAQRVSELRKLPDAKRDIPFENIQLFNRDSLILRALKHSVKRGDIGSVINILAHWMLMFRGTGKMPKYADALFHLLAYLKRMHPRLRDAFLKNWLANLSGKVNGFKEMDLLQEHQNFWAKIIYNARGSNRSWKWLAMVTVSIFTLRDVIRRVQLSYKIPYNSTSHTSPAANEDIADIRNYLEQQTLQSYTPNRKENERATPARDLLSTGAAYANTAGAFNNFLRDTRNAVNHGTAHGDADNVPTASNHVTEDDADVDLGAELELDVDDLAMDSEEFPPGTDIADFISMAREVVDELSRYD